MALGPSDLPQGYSQVSEPLHPSCTASVLGRHRPLSLGQGHKAGPGPMPSGSHNRLGFWLTTCVEEHTSMRLV